MGAVFGVVFPDGGGFHHETGGIQLQNGGQMLVGDILHKGIGGQVGNATQVKFVAHTHHGASHFLVPFLGNIVALAQLLNQQGSGDIGVQIPILHKVLEIVPPCGGVGSQSILKGTGGGDGEVVDVADPQLLALLHQTVQRFVGAAGAFDNIVVEHQIIAGAVAHQHIAVAVQNIPPGGADGGDGGVGGGVVLFALGVDDLQPEQPSCVKQHHQTEEQKENDGPKAAYSFHVFSPIRPIFWIRV